MFRLVSTLLLCLMFSAPLIGGAEEVEVDESTVIGERDRLASEMRSLVRRQVWAGVERKYRQLVRLNVELSSEIHLIGAYAARERGDLMKVYDRLKRAAATKPSKEVVDWLWDIDHNYGHVVLLADRRGSAELKPAVMPLDPNQRKAVEAAVKKAESSGSFEGLLPRGTYTFVSQEFRVEPGIGVRIEVSPKMRRQGLIEPVIIYRDLPTATGTPK